MGEMLGGTFGAALILNFIGEKILGGPPALIRNAFGSSAWHFQLGMYIAAIGVLIALVNRLPTPSTFVDRAIGLLVFSILFAVIVRLITLLFFQGSITLLFIFFALLLIAFVMASRRKSRMG
jgi:hypothetical protein